MIPDDLVQWLRAQLDDDERAAQAAANYSAERGYSFPTDGSGTYGMLAYEHEQHATRHNPARVLRDIAAKRQILDRLAEDAAFDMPATKAQAASHDEWYLIVTARDVIKLLALPYADRPGYREERRP